MVKIKNGDLTVKKIAVKGALIIAEIEKTQLSGDDK